MSCMPVGSSSVRTNDSLMCSSYICSCLVQYALIDQAQNIEVSHEETLHTIRDKTLSTQVICISLRPLKAARLCSSLRHLTEQRPRQYYDSESTLAKQPRWLTFSLFQEDLGGVSMSLNAIARRTALTVYNNERSFGMHHCLYGICLRLVQSS